MHHLSILAGISSILFAINLKTVTANCSRFVSTSFENYHGKQAAAMRLAWGPQKSTLTSRFQR